MFADSDTCTAHSDRASNKSISISAALAARFSQIDLHFVAIEENIQLGSTSPVGMITLPRISQATTSHLFLFFRQVSDFL